MKPLFGTDGRPGIDRPPVMLAFGGGVDSTAALVCLFAVGTVPDATLFADTGGEKPETYQALFRTDDWMLAHGFPRNPSTWVRPPGYEDVQLPESRRMECLVVVRNDGIHGTLERNCVDRRMLPSLAYGFHSCAEKYKTRPQDKWAKTWAPARTWWRMGKGNRRPKDAAGRVIKMIGYNAEESWRSKVESSRDYRYVYPLREWGIGRFAGERVVKAAGLPVPPKSSCFFCPANKKREIAALALQWPGLMGRALAMERGAKLSTMKGLGRYFNWSEFLAGVARGAPIADGGPCVRKCH